MKHWACKRRVKLLRYSNVEVSLLSLRNIIRYLKVAASIKSVEAPTGRT